MKQSIEKTSKYIAVKMKGFDYYVWFERDNTANVLGVFTGVGGWGKGGALTELKCRDNEIDSQIFSNELQYT